MSSSTFIERNAISNTLLDDHQHANSNLIVIYGKNGISFDDEGLKNVIDEKKISSISVVRLTSPTPSMKDEEEEMEELEELRQQELNSDDESAGEDNSVNFTHLDGKTNCNDNDADDILSHSDQLDKLENEYLDSDDDTLSENKYSLRKVVRHRVSRIQTNAKQNNLRCKNFRRKAKDIVGIQVEEFYSSERAYQIINDALKMAGLSTQQQNKDYSFQLMVIQNDHCYTPYTSPLQTKAKLESNRKLGVIVSNTDRDLDTILPAKTYAPVKVAQNRMIRLKTKKLQDLRNEVNQVNRNDNRFDVGFDDISIQHSSTPKAITCDPNSYVKFVGKGYKGVNYEKHEADSLQPAKRVYAVRLVQNKTKTNSLTSQSNDMLERSGCSRSLISIFNHSQTTNSDSMKSKNIAHIEMKTPEGSPLSTPNANDKPNNSLDNNIIIMKKQSTPKLSKTTLSATTIHTELDVNPEQSLTYSKSCDNEQSRSQTYPANDGNPFSSVPVASMPANELEHSAFSLNVGHDELTDPIALHSNTNSYVLAAENDKQLDLINAIVEDEMQNGNKIVKQDIDEPNTDIPVLVRMLENTVNSLQNKSTVALEDNDMSSTMTSMGYNTDNIAGDDKQLCDTLPAGLDNDLQIIDENFLTATDDDDGLPDDILQQVVELIKDEDQQSFGKIDNSANAEFILQDAMSNNEICLTQEINDGKQSMITNQLFNANATSDVPAHATTSIDGNEQLYDYASARGNGRLMGAPTTRAKRRLAELESNDKTVKQTVYCDAKESSDDLMPANSSTSSSLTAITPSSGRRTSSKDASNLAANSKISRKVLTRKPRKQIQSNRRHSNSESNFDDNDNEANDDDDPNKLWCICRQPHNNRFMICCDVCGDWFHGTCVTITKAMGLEMEQKGIDWTCPNCLKKQEEKKQLKISDMFKKMPSINESNIKAISSITTTTTTTTDGATASSVTSVSSLSSGHTSTKIVNYEIRACKVKRSPAESTILHINHVHDNKTDKQTVIPVNSKTSAQRKTITTGAKQILNSAVALAPKRSVNLLGQQQATNNCSLYNKSRISKIIHLSLPCSTTSSTTTTTAGSIAANESAGKCIVCKRIPRPHTIYCSDDCIRKHAQNALNALVAKSHQESDVSALKNIHKPDDMNTKKKAKGLFEDLLSMADRKPKIERVNVIERRSGRILTGMNAPTTTNLKRWLQENPTFEVLPVSFAKAINQHNLHNAAIGKQNASASTQNVTIIRRKETFETESANKSKGMLIKNALKITHTQTHDAEKKPSAPTATAQSSIIQIQKPQTKFVQKLERGADRTYTLKFTSATQTPNPKITSTTMAKTSTPVQINSNAPTAPAKFAQQPIRLNVQRTLRDHLLQRIQVESSDATDGAVDKQLTADEVAEFAKNTELEMFNYFCRNTGSKYRAKYRSLIFNIKDRKNKTLYAKICGKLITPKQLVHMTPEEMASQELAQWRENETKHQLEIIKKSELDLLNFNKSYQLKSHKSEEIPDDAISAPNPLEVITLTRNSNDDYSKASTKASDRQLEDAKEPCPVTVPDNQKLADVKKTAARAALSLDFDPNRHQSSSISSSSGSNSKYKPEKSRHHKEKRQKLNAHKRHRSYSRSRSRSPSRSPDYSKRYKTHRHHHYDHHRHHHHQHHHHHRKSDPKHDKSKQTSSNSLKYSNQKQPDAGDPKKEQQQQHHSKQRKSPKPLEAFNLIDQILESTKTVEEAANLVTDKLRKDYTRKDYSNSAAAASSKSTKHVARKTVASFNETEQDKTSNTSPPPPPNAFSVHDPYHLYSIVHDATDVANIWTGNINMIDVASFQISLQPVLGNYSSLSKCLPAELDVVGRINPDTVWDYISKIKKSPNKEILITRLMPSTTTEINAYTTLYRYLENRNRLGVIKTSTSTHIKDFYIHPLGADKRMPCIIRTNEQLDSFHNSNRPDLLIGIIIRIVSKRSAFANALLSDFSNSSNTNSPKYYKKRRHSIIHNVHEIDVDAIIKAPIINKNQHSAALPIVTPPNANDADEPYSPGGSTDEDDMSLPTVKMPPTQDKLKSVDNELKRKMDEINRQIAAQELEIAGLLNGDTTSFASSANTSHVLANISIPSNLSQILASIKPSTSSSSAAFNEKEAIASPSTSLFGALNKQNPAYTKRFQANYQTNVNDVSSAATTSSTTTGSTSRLAQLTEEELLRLVPDDMIINSSLTRNPYGGQPPPPGV